MNRRDLRDPYPFHRQGACMGYVPAKPAPVRKNGAEKAFWIIFCCLGTSGLVVLGLTLAGVAMRVLSHG